jgi:hypothetical protein
VDDKFNGFGVLKSKEIGDYEGEFKDDKFHGFGTLKFKNGDKY